MYAFEVGEGVNGAQVWLEHNTVLPPGRQGYGTVHHAAFRVEKKSDLEPWDKHLRSFRFGTSGYVERFYFGSLYTRVSPEILFEIASDEPGFTVDEPYETLGESLSLPPFFENQRAEIEKLIRHFDTVRSTKVFEKEYE